MKGKCALRFKVKDQKKCPKCFTSVKCIAEPRYTNCCERKWKPNKCYIKTVLWFLPQLSSLESVLILTPLLMRIQTRQYMNLHKRLMSHASLLRGSLELVSKISMPVSVCSFLTDRWFLILRLKQM